MLALVLLVVSIGFADSLNPSTVLPALYMSTTHQAPRRIAAFTLGVFGVSFLAGVLIVAGPGQLLLHSVPHLSKTTKHIVEILVGAVLLVVALGFWRGGASLTERIPRGSSTGGRSSFVLGAGIMVVELPTALPYFAAIAAIIGSGESLAAQIGYVLLFNVVFVLPVLAILAFRMTASQGAERRILALGEWIRHYAHTAVALIAALAGAAFLVVGLVGLI